MASFDGPALARAGTGVCYGYFEQTDAAAGWREASPDHSSTLTRSSFQLPSQATMPKQPSVVRL